MKKFFWWTCIVLAILATLVVGFILIMTYLAPPWPERLAGVRIEPLRPLIPSADDLAETNGYYYIHQYLITNTPGQLPYDLKEEARRYLAAGGNLKAVTNRFADDLVHRMDPFIKVLEKSASQPDYQTVVLSPENESHSYDVLHLARMMPAYVDILASRQRAGDAIRATDRFTTLAERYSRGGAILDDLIGRHIYQHANTGRAILAEKQFLSPTISRRWMQRLSEYPDRVQSLAESLRCERLFMEDVVIDFYNTYDLELLTQIHGNTRWHQKLLILSSRLVGSSETNTRRHFRNFFSHLIGRLEDPSLGDGHAFIWDFAQKQSAPWSFFDDPIGKIFIKITVPALPNPAQYQVSPRGTRLLLAARMYERDTGNIPARLEDLVPKYIEAIPQDPCDPTGGPFLYKDGIIYSRYRNQVDDGAPHAYEKQTDSKGDATFPIDLFRYRLKHYKSAVP